MKRCMRCLAVAVLMASVPAMAAGETLESVQKKIVAQGKTITSLSSTSTYWTNDKSAAVRIKSEGKSTYEFMKKGDKVLYRMESSYSTSTEMNGTKQSSKGETLTVSDGEIMYMYTNMDGNKSVMKQRAFPQGGGIEQSYFDGLAEAYTLELQPDAKVGTRSAYVIRATLRSPVPMMAVEQMMYFDKASGVMLKSVSKNKAGEVTMETITTDLKVNSTINADRFVFHAPKGVPVTDMTQQGG